MKFSTQLMTLRVTTSLLVPLSPTVGSADYLTCANLMA
jgi:hypothetical protein